MLDRLTLDQLRVLLAVAEAGSFSGAARRLGRVQSAVSQAAQALEATLGTPLFDRSGKTPRLTPAGEVLLTDAREILRGAELMRARAESIASGIEAEIMLAVDQAFPKTVLMAGLRALRRAFPHLAVTMFSEGLAAPEQRLRDRAAQVAIYWPPNLQSADLEVEFLAAIPLIPVVAAGHPLAAARGPLERSVLEQHVQLLWTDGSPLGAGVTGGIVSRQLWRFDDLGSRLEYLLAGFGWCSMPQHLVEEHIAAGRLKRLALKEHGGRTFSYPLYAVHRRGHPPGRAGRWLLAELRRELPEGDGPHAPREYAPPTTERRR